MVVTLGQQYNVGEKPTVILYTFVVFCFIFSKNPSEEEKVKIIVDNGGC